MNNKPTYKKAFAIALLIVGLLTAISLFAPPFISFDPAYGFWRWRSFLQGAPFDSTIFPDPSNIANDKITNSSWWSPGQYAVPGIMALSGIRFGTTIPLIAGLCNLAALFGWVRVTQAFALGPVVALLAVVFIATFRYSTQPYGIYNGGEILLQAVTPWIIVFAYQIPNTSVFNAAVLSVFIVSAGYFAKLSGIIVAAAALTAASTMTLYQMRRITPGMLGGLLGSLLAVTMIYVFWFSGRETTHFSGGGAPIDLVRILFSLSAPWTAGISWQDLMAWLFQNPSRIIFRDSYIIVVFIFPAACVLAAVTALSRSQNAGQLRFKMFSIVFLFVFTALMVLLYALSSPIPLEERHYRPAGILLFICLLSILVQPNTKWPIRLGLLSIFCAMSCYGIASFALRALNKDRVTIDAYSWTKQPNADSQSLALIRQAYAEEGRDALFYLGGPELVTTLPFDARIYLVSPDLEPEDDLLALRYRGTVKGHIYVVLNNSLPIGKVNAILNSFLDYDPNKWAQNRFSTATVYVQAAANKNN